MNFHSIFWSHLLYVHHQTVNPGFDDPPTDLLPIPYMNPPADKGSLIQFTMHLYASLQLQIFLFTTAHHAYRKYGQFSAHLCTLLSQLW